MKKAIEILKKELEIAKRQATYGDTREGHILGAGIVKGYEMAIKDLEEAATRKTVMAAYELYKKYEFAETKFECDLYYNLFKQYDEEIQEAAKEMRKTYMIENNIF